MSEKNIIKILLNKENLDLAENLLQLDDETFKLAKEIFVDSKIKFIRGLAYWKNLAICIINDWEKEGVPTKNSHNNLRKLIKRKRKKRKELK